MGTNCGTKATPASTNVCGSAGQIVKIPHFCSIRTDGKSDFCKSMGAPGEWAYHSRGDTCYTKTYHGIPHTDYGFGCCKGKCGVPSGTGLKCVRKAFTGDKLKCCFQDYDKCGKVNSSDSTCFSDFDTNNTTKTCDPKYRDITSSSCKDVVFDYCTGKDLNTDEEFEQSILKRWSGDIKPDEFLTNDVVKNSPCYRVIWRNMYNNDEGVVCSGIPEPSIIPDGEGFVYAQKLFSGLLQSYISHGGDLSSSANSGGSRYLDEILYSICSAYPGVCQNGLKTYCSSKSTDDLIRDPTLQRWCGCYMQDNEYSKYTNIYRINKECTPQCNATGVIPLPTTDGVGIKKCDQSTCVIDDISIQLYQSNVGDLNFSQMCPSCAVTGGATCNCTLAGSTMSIIDSTVPNMNLSQNCGSGSTCFNKVDDENGKEVSIRVPCSSSSSYDPYKEIKLVNLKNYQTAVKKRNGRVVLIIGVAFFILLFLIFILNPSYKIKPSSVKYPAKRKTVSVKKSFIPSNIGVRSIHDRK
jgi:hypothetical protein